MAGVWGVEVDTWSLKRGAHKKSLTGFGRKTRTQIVNDVFYYKDGFCDIKTPVILIDDVLTKGTILSCVEIFSKKSNNCTWCCSSCVSLIKESIFGPDAYFIKYH